MFDRLLPYSRIIVTGTQRSGTRIAAKMIAADLGLRFVDENEIRIYRFDLLAQLLMTTDNIVVQAPAISRWAHDLPNSPAVVYMLRNPADVRDSADRIGWSKPFEAGQLANYGVRPDEGRPIYDVKLDFWRRVQRPALGDRAFEIEYESLAVHPLWVPREERRGWTWGQTRNHEQ